MTCCLEILLGKTSDDPQRNASSLSRSPSPVTRRNVNLLSCLQVQTRSYGEKFHKQWLDKIERVIYLLAWIRWRGGFFLHQVRGPEGWPTRRMRNGAGVRGWVAERGRCSSMLGGIWVIPAEPMDRWTIWRKQKGGWIPCWTQQRWAR